ncbi:hypothetical protein [Paracoccus nototheniae]|uniref:hypothetical protein n=1 Tax=Paracoccus nototheniae TaxID=2489002 RepID=UPI00103F13BE|nr:hypothetical protein [Paracoccus nototheniae]
MQEQELRKLILAAGLSEGQVEEVIRHLWIVDEIPQINTTAAYKAAKARYDLISGFVPPNDTHSPAARYIIALGARLIDWEQNRMR